ncbi:hypothetical protein R3P38DRAFT_2779653 [Favolaschia claudopus]|uniref:Uncharacterized protein n=1 Tax=Favolaschia claudopus TaxID=2862362 RepID=A0AAW0BDG0_9AGAR
MRTTQVQLWSVGIIWSTKLRNPPQSGAKRNKSESKCSQNANLASRLALWCSGSDKHCTVDMSTAISSSPKDSAIKTTQVQLWSMGIIWGSELRHPPQSGAKRNKSGSKSTENAILGGRCQQRSLPAPRIPQSRQHRCSCGPWGSSGAPNCEIRRSPGRRGINWSQKALKMPFWVADVNGDLFQPQGFRNQDNTSAAVVYGDHLEHRTVKSPPGWGEEE